MLLQMYVNVVRRCIRCGTNMYRGGTKMGGMKRHWYEKPGIRFEPSSSITNSNSWLITLW